MKLKKRYVCKECGYVSPSWLGKCPECISWNSFIEEIIEEPKKTSLSKSSNVLKNSIDIKIDENLLIRTENVQVNNFFGEGIVTGSSILISGEPGSGKSTFLLYLSNIFESGKKVFYFSGEETLTQIKKRIDRLNIKNSNLYISNEIEIEKIIEICKKEKPDIIFIDSIQTCYSIDVDSQTGSISQIKRITENFVRFAKETDITIILVGHITKSGDIAGPKVIEHTVDVVVYFENDYKNQYRVIRSTKNRFGSIDEILMFEMNDTGLNLIENPSILFIDDDEKNCIGKCKAVIVEGRRPLVVEIEALIVPSSFSNPRRISESLDISRLNRISAILTKFTDDNYNNYDIYVNISGGLKTNDVGIDLAICAVIISSKNKKIIKNTDLILGEVSLTGKIRNVFRIEQRIKEAKKFGINRFFIPNNTDIVKNKEIIIQSDIIDFISDYFK